MRRVICVMAAYSALVLPVFAQTAAHPGPPQLWVELPPEFSMVSRNPAEGKVKLGNRAIEFEKTKLTALATDLRFPVGDRGDAATALHWICLFAGTQRIWLTSDEMGGGRINGIQLTVVAPGQKADADCKTAPANLSTVSLPNGLSLGMSEQSLRAMFGPPTYAKSGTVGFLHSREIAGGGTLSTSLWARTVGGKVTALSLGQMTSF